VFSSQTGVFSSDDVSNFHPPVETHFNPYTPCGRTVIEITVVSMVSHRQGLSFELRYSWIPEEHMATAAQLESKQHELVARDFKKIVLATDFSSTADKALKWAAAIAKHYHAEIAIVHAIAPEPREAVPMDPLPPEMDSAYAEARRQIGRLDQEEFLSRLPHHTILQHGSAADVISSVIKQNNTDLLVVGTRGRTGLARLVLGSVAEELLRTAECPVLTVGPLVGSGPEITEFKTILFATDFGVASEKAFQYAASIADRYKAKLVLLHTIAPVAEFAPISMDYTPAATLAEHIADWEDRARVEAVSKLKNLASSFSRPLEYQCAVSLDFSPAAILELMASHKPELLVMGANRTPSTRLAAHLPWTVLHGVLCGARCPVLTIAG
jgi:nucleotide-binding universal stress UspA family protein